MEYSHWLSHQLAPSAKKEEFQAGRKGGGGEAGAVAVGMLPQERAFLSHRAPKDPCTLDWYTAL